MHGQQFRIAPLHRLQVLVASAPGARPLRSYLGTAENRPRYHGAFASPHVRGGSSALQQTVAFLHHSKRRLMQMRAWHIKSDCCLRDIRSRYARGRCRYGYVVFAMGCSGLHCSTRFLFLVPPKTSLRFLRLDLGSQPRGAQLALANSVASCSRYHRIFVDGDALKRS